MRTALAVVILGIAAAIYDHLYMLAGPDHQGLLVFGSLFAVLVAAGQRSAVR